MLSNISPIIPTFYSSQINFITFIHFIQSEKSVQSRKSYKSYRSHEFYLIHNIQINSIHKFHLCQTIPINSKNTYCMYHLQSIWLFSFSFIEFKKLYFLFFYIIHELLASHSHNEIRQVNLNLLIYKTYAFFVNIIQHFYF